MASEPIHVVRFGLIKCEIYRNHTRSGERYSATLTRLYRNGSVWQTSKVFGRDDLLVAAKSLDVAHTVICELCQAEQPAEHSEPSS
jgi:hypothetical protein